MNVPTPAKVVESSNASIARMSAMVSLVLMGAAAWMFWESEVSMSLDVTSRDFNPITLIVYAFLVIGLIFLARALVYWGRLAKFSPTTLTCEPVYPGHTLRAVIRAERDVQATGPYVITLKCIETEHLGDDVEGSSRHREHERWMHKTTREADTVWLSRGIPIEIPIPRGVLPSFGDPLAVSGGRVRWILTVTAPVRGQDYSEIFLVNMAEGPVAEDDEV